jgi:hypothetical protein
MIHDVHRHTGKLLRILAGCLSSMCTETGFTGTRADINASVLSVFIARRCLQPDIVRANCKLECADTCADEFAVSTDEGRRPSPCTLLEKPFGKAMPLAPFFPTAYMLRSLSLSRPTLTKLLGGKLKYPNSAMCMLACVLVTSTFASPLHRSRLCEIMRLR